MFGLIWTAATLTLSQPPIPAKMGLGDETRKPKLIAKGEGYFVHALPPLGNPAPFTREGLTFFGDTRTNVDGPVILHTSLATGEMKILAAGWSSAQLGPPMGIDRIYIQRTGIAGVAADRQRLYVLQWQGKSEEMVQAAMRENRGEVKYHLLVFRPDTGKLVQKLELKEGDLPKEAPRQTADRGPLQLRDNGVVCFGVTFMFKGTRLVKQQYEKKP
jgi:hypothetical protein